MQSRDEIRQIRRCVIKIGSALLTDNGRGLAHAAMDGWVQQVAALRKQGVEVVLVSSGAVAEGMSRLGWDKRPKALHELQAAAAVGQMGLIEAYESRFQHYGLHTAQILLTHDDLSNRKRYLNARSTLNSLLQMGVVPVVNENDTVVTEEIKFGDNDTLAALVGNLVEAELLIILTDQQGLFDKDPRQHTDARLIHEGVAGDPQYLAVAGDGGKLGRGGMRTKLTAAALAARSGTSTVIAYGREPDVLTRLYQGEELGTLLRAQQAPDNARKQWLAGHLQLAGSLQLDDGAVKVLRESGRSLLAVGVKRVEGEFSRGALVRCVDCAGVEVARGLVNYSAAESRLIMGQPSERIEEIIGYVDEAELIHRDNLILV